MLATRESDINFCEMLLFVMLPVLSLRDKIRLGLLLARHNSQGFCPGGRCVCIREGMDGGYATFLRVFLPCFLLPFVPPASDSLKMHFLDVFESKT